MQPIFFSNPDNIISHKFKEMIDKVEAVREKTDDYELIKMSKHILGKDYYNDLHILDLEIMAWSRPNTSGPAPSQR